MEGGRGHRAASAPRGLPTASVAGLVLSMTEEQLAAVRLYTAKEVVQMLRLKPTWLKNWITEERVPHVRASGQRGVRFTAAHILAIRGMLPDLLGGHRGGPTAGGALERASRAEQPTCGAVGQQLGNGGSNTSPAAVPAVVDISAWSQLRAHRPRPRST
jgi:hypothetical protein